jgi:hypothetical protein
MAHANPQPIKLIPWTGGLNTVTNPTVLDPMQLTVATNIDYAFDGTREKRGGVKVYNSTRIIVTEE